MHGAIYEILCMAYAVILRSLLIKAIDDPNEDWDDLVLNLCDTLFNYTEK